MLRKINSIAENVFGPQGWEKDLHSCKNTKIVRFIFTIRTVRLVFFPLSSLIWIAVIVVDQLSTGGVSLSKILYFLFENTNDSIWLNESWFGLKEIDINKEILEIKSINTGKSKDALIKEMEDELNGC